MRLRSLNPCLYVALAAGAAGILAPVLLTRSPQAAVATGASGVSAVAAVTLPRDPAVPLDPSESVVLAQKKRLMGKPRSLEMVARVVTELSPLVQRALEMPSIRSDLRALAAGAGMSLAEYRRFFQAKQEADLLLESGGDPNARSVSNAIGVAQFMGGTGRRCGLRVDLAASAACSREIHRLEAKIAWLARQSPEWSKPAPLGVVALSGTGSVPVWKRDDWLRARRAERSGMIAARRSVDERFDPAKAIAAQARYLARLARRYGSLAWALQAYHGGEGGVARTINLFRRGVASRRLDRSGVPRYEEIYHRTGPLSRSGAFYYLYGRSDDHRYYWWKVLMAERAIRLYRADPAEFRRQWQALRPGYRMEVTWYGEAEPLAYSDRTALRRALAAGQLVPIPRDLAPRGVKIGDVAPLDRDFAGDYKCLRPEAMGALLRLASTYRRNAGKGPLRVLALTQTSALAAALREVRPAIFPARPPGDSAEDPDFHPTGLVFDLARPANDWDRRVLEYSLGQLYDRLRISWLVEKDYAPWRYHVVPSPTYRQELAKAAGFPEP